LDAPCCGIAYFLTGGCFLFGWVVRAQKKHRKLTAQRRRRSRPHLTPPLPRAAQADCCYIGVLTQACNAKYMGGGGSVAVLVQNSNNVVMPSPQAGGTPGFYAASPPPQQQQLPVAQPAYYPPTAPAASGPAFCGSCGAAATGVPFCGSCGKRV
jgi:hypothetical protein